MKRLSFPTTRGAEIIYHKAVRPAISEYENSDKRLNDWKHRMDNVKQQTFDSTKEE